MNLFSAHLRVIIARSFFSAVVLAIIFAATACTSGQQPTATSEPNAQPASAAKYDPATAATIAGVVHFTGSVPKPQPIDMSEDPACKGQNAGESLVVHDGRLANAVVYIKDGLPPGGLIYAKISTSTGSEPDPTSGIIRQKGCRYVPHVVAVNQGSRISVFNDDPTTHNIHPLAHANHEWNQSQSPGAEPITRTFDKPELMIPVKCNVHPWMRAYINVMVNPFYAITNNDGTFTISGLPPGTYTIAAVHETLGEQTAQITIGPKENKVTDFTFKAAPNPASAAR